MYNKKWKDWYLENYDQEFNDENGYQRKEGMDDETFAIGQNLYNNYIAGQNATNVYDNAVTEVDTQKFKDIKQLEATYQKLMKYLPEINASQGIGNLGIAQSTYVGAANNYQNNLGAVNEQANTSKTSLLEKYQTALAENEINANDNESGIRADWVDKYKEAAEQAKNEVAGVMGGYFDEKTNAYTEEGKAKAQAYIDANKSQLGNQYDFVNAYLETNFDTEPAVTTPPTAEGTEASDFETKTQEERGSLKTIKDATGKETGYTITAQKSYNKKYATEISTWASKHNANITLESPNGETKSYEVEAKRGARGFFVGEAATALDKIIEKMEPGEIALIDGEIYLRLKEYVPVNASKGTKNSINYVQMETAEKAKDDYSLLKAQLAKMGVVYTTK